MALLAAAVTNCFLHHYHKKKSATVVTMQNLLTGETHTYSAMDPFIGTSASFADTPGFWYVTIIQDGQLIYADTVMY